MQLHAHRIILDPDHMPYDPDGPYGEPPIPPQQDRCYRGCNAHDCVARESSDPKLWYGVSEA